METNETKHTPGPWTATGHDGGMCVVVESKWGSVAKALPVGCEVQEAANARLIAAAPELLEALEEIAEQLELEGPSCSDILAAARAAIAKARGGVR